jgi:iron(III) transport system ATP-binding protein
MVFQEYTLFPHLTVEQNIAFGLRRLGHPNRAQRVEEMLDMVALTALGRRYPHELSGGQQQRAALARALAPHPSILLLDEPFSNLDATLRAHMLHEVYTILRDAGTTAIFVTHDQEEAFMVADRVAVLNRGRLEQIGRPEEIYHLPATRFVARFVGKADCVPGCVTAAGIETEIGTFPNTANLAQATPVDVMIRPDQLELVPDPSGKAIVISHRFRGADTLVVVQLPSGLILQSSQPPTLLVMPQERVKVAARATHVVAFLATQPER